MAYFSNGSEGMCLDEECCECVLGSESPCPIFSVQVSYNYSACNNEIARQILNDLITQASNEEYIGCQVKKLLDIKFKQTIFPTS